MRIILVLAMLLGVGTALPALAAQMTNADLAKSCEKRVALFNRQGDRIGQQVDAFCAGYLAATLDSLLTASTCNVSEAQGPADLLTVYQSYQKDTGAPAADPAARTAAEAFKKALKCR